jgi:amino acid transporter
MLFGAPIASQRERHERLSIPVALAVFAADALSSTAYATEEILLALSATVFAAYSNLLSLPIAAAIILLMVVVVLSYRQVIIAYSDGGGTYQVAKAHLGENASHVAGAALLIDYVLTAAVSVSAGVDALVSAQWVAANQRVEYALLFIGLITFANLRGVKESGALFSIPAYIFIATMVGMVSWGFMQLAQQGGVWAHAAAEPTGGWSSLLGFALTLALLKAFSHGCSALTGIEAISNGVKAFKEPSASNANKTMVLMGFILGFLFLGMTILAFAMGVMPQQGNTVVSQLGQQVFGAGSPLYYLLQGVTTVILIFAANTSFGGFPRLASILANDGYLPRQLMNLGDRLVFSNGVVLLGAVSALLVWAYNASTHALIPMYAVGVFLSFTLAQAGMCRHHLVNKAQGWQVNLVVNGLGAVTTSIATLILLLEKFTEGAWIVIVATIGIMGSFRLVKEHYLRAAKQLILPPRSEYKPQPIEHTVLVLVSSLHRGTIPALEYARTISNRVEAVHVELRPELTKRLMEAWDDWGQGIPLTILKSPYRSITQPLMEYIQEVEERYDNDMMTIIVPEFVTKKFWHNVLHNQSSLMIKTLLGFKRNKVVTSLRYFLEE